MNLLKPLINSSKTVDVCLLCFKNDNNSFDIYSVFEIHNNCEIMSVSLYDMLNNLFPDKDFIFRQICNHCSDLISELFLLIHNRNSKILLLDNLIKQLAVKTNAICDIPVNIEKLVFNVEPPTHQKLNEDIILNKDNGIHIDCPLTYISNENKFIKCRNSGAQRVKIYSETLRAEEYRETIQVKRKKRQRRHIYHHCNDCNYKTLSKTTLQAHINKHHLNTRPHICQLCFKGFYNKSNLNEHIKTHDNQRHQVCELCGCSFIHKKSLIEHLRLHSDTRPYKCDICHKSFVTSGRRSDHIKRSHMEKTECCLICNKKYSLKKEVTRHMNNVHLRGM